MTDNTYTVEQLLAMSDDTFHNAVTRDLKANGRSGSPFQDPQVIDRTYEALLEHLWTTDATMQRQAEDPKISAEHFARTRAFRRHILTVADLTDLRIRRRRSSAGESAAWRKLLNEVLDEIEGGPEDAILDDLSIPFPGRRGTDEPALTLREWLETRRIKDPSRMPVKELAVAA